MYRFLKIFEVLEKERFSDFQRWSFKKLKIITLFVFETFCFLIILIKRRSL